MAAADLLCRVTGINKRSWPLSVHELSAAIFYALAQHRSLRGNDPGKEEWMHALIKEDGKVDLGDVGNTGNDSETRYVNTSFEIASKSNSRKFKGFCLEDSNATNATECNPCNEHQLQNNTIVDESDTYNPMQESYADLLKLADFVLKSHNNNTGSETTIDELESNLIIEQAMSVPTGGDFTPSLTTDIPPAQKGLIDFKSSPSLRLSCSQRHLPPKNPVCSNVSDSLISSLLLYAPVALHFIYCTNAVDIQLLAAQQSWHLIYAHLEQDATLSDRPASALFVHRDQKIACFAVRGTATINDVVTDIRAMPVPFPENPSSGKFEDDWTPVSRAQGLALCGMARAADHLFRENIDALFMLAQKGYRIRITGHSLGGGVAALLGALVYQFLEKKTNIGDALNDAISEEKNSRRSFLNGNDLLRVYTFGIPACVDAKLADFAQSFVTSVVLHDDVIPRLTPTSIRALLKHLLHIRKTWVKAHLNEDINSIADRLKRGWAPRWRGSFTMHPTKVDSIKSSSKWLKQATLKYYKKKVCGARKCMDENLPEYDAKLSKTTKNEGEIRNEDTKNEGNNVAKIVSDLEEDYSEADGDVLFDGDQFFEALQYEDGLLEEDDSVQDVSNTKIKSTLDDDSVPFDEPPIVIDSFSSNVEMKDASKTRACNLTPPVILEETPLPRMFIPGEIVHIYTHNGGYKAASVPRTFRELRRISLAGNMLSDHTTKCYYESLLEVRSIRKAKCELPEWTSFGDDVTCSCCASPFTWASTSNSEAQEARDKHNCRACGSLVCDPCSKNRVPLPKMGLDVSMRVCDRCFHDLGEALETNGEGTLTRSFIAGEEPHHPESACDQEIIAMSKDNSKMKQKRTRRNAVVDDLAHRVELSSM